MGTAGNGPSCNKNRMNQKDSRSELYIHIRWPGATFKRFFVYRCFYGGHLIGLVPTPLPVNNRISEICRHNYSKKR